LIQHSAAYGDRFIVWGVDDIFFFRTYGNNIRLPIGYIIENLVKKYHDFRLTGGKQNVQLYGRT
jgi:hypothetical protein